MSTKSYSASERGGGTGETGRRRAAILNQISTWWMQAHWVDPDKADRIFEKLQEAPELYITPEPGADYQEEAKRCYEAIKEEYSLQTHNEAKQEARDWEKREERYIERKKRAGETETQATAETASDETADETAETIEDTTGETDETAGEAADWGALEPDGRGTAGPTDEAADQPTEPVAAVPGDIGTIERVGYIVGRIARRATAVLGGSSAV